MHQDRRGTFIDMQYLSHDRVELHYEMPLAEIDHGLLRPAQEPHHGLRLARLRAASATAPGDLVKLDILLAGEPVDALSLIVHRDKPTPRQGADREAAASIIPRQMFEVPIQAAIGRA